MGRWGLGFRDRVWEQEEWLGAGGRGGAGGIRWGMGASMR